MHACAPFECFVCVNSSIGYRKLPSWHKYSKRKCIEYPLRENVSKQLLSLLLSKKLSCGGSIVRFCCLAFIVFSLCSLFLMSKIDAGCFDTCFHILDMAWTCSRENNTPNRYSILEINCHLPGCVCFLTLWENRIDLSQKWNNVKDLNCYS